MFTGIIEATGTVLSITATKDGGRVTLRIQGFPVSELTEGESIAVNGCCLTATDLHAEANTVSFDLLSQTMKVTNLGDLEEGSTVNLERAMVLGGRLSGHLVQGHVDTTGELVQATPLAGDDYLIEVRIATRLFRHIIEKGSICLDGISLTAAELDENQGLVRCYIIPHTWENTRLQHLAIGARINVEFDMVGKWIAKLHPGTQ